MLLKDSKFPVNLFIILWLVLNKCKCETNNYCGPDYCNNSREHVMCKYKSSGPASSCLDYKKIIISEEDKQEVLDRINGRRNKVASGEIRSLPSAENMYKMVWSKELEILAQRWADQCVSNNSLEVTDSCRDLPNNTYVGQNVATLYGDAPGLTAASLVDLWYMELLNINLSIMSRFAPSSLTLLPHYEYFTQLTWAESSHVGCGGVSFKETGFSSNEKKRTIHTLVCNFLPGGNINGQSVYASGLPCSRCPNGKSCDLDYSSLCVSDMHIIPNNTEDDLQGTENPVRDVFDFITEDRLIFNEEYEVTTKSNYKTTNFNADDYTNFDLLSHLFEITITRQPVSEQSTRKCKEDIAIDELLTLFKNRLNNDQSLKELLLATPSPSNEPTFTDGTVAAIINNLYSKKEVTTISKPTENENINSTLLVDLVEAVIFRHADKFSTTQGNNLHNKIAPSVIPVKIQAELGEVKTNNDFTGHYFFPEEEETIEQETTEFYDDTESLPVSDISFEIENLKRNRETKDFLEEILDSEFMTESIIRDQPVLSKNIAETVQRKKKEVRNINFPRQAKSIHTYNKRIKRKLHTNSLEIRHDGIFIKYNDLLQKLASDLRVLQLNKNLHCFSNSTENLFFTYYYLIISIYYFIL